MQIFDHTAPYRMYKQTRVGTPGDLRSKLHWTVIHPSYDGHTQKVVCDEEHKGSVCGELGGSNTSPNQCCNKHNNNKIM